MAPGEGPGRGVPPMGGSGVDIALDLLLLGEQQGPEINGREEVRGGGGGGGGGGGRGPLRNSFTLSKSN